MKSILSQENKKKLMGSNSCCMLGVLALNEEYYPSYGEEQECITQMKNSSSIIFYIKPISDDPIPVMDILNPIIPTDIYAGVDIHQREEIIPTSSLNYKYSDITYKKEYILNKFKDKIILFKPKINVATNDVIYKNIEIISLEPMLEATDKSVYLPVPKLNIKNIEFENKIREGTNISLDEYNHNFIEPDYLICGNHLYFNFSGWTRHSNNTKMWSYPTAYWNIKRVPFNIKDSSISSNIIKGTADSLIFIRKDFIKGYIDNAEKVETLRDDFKELDINIEIKGKEPKVKDTISENINMEALNQDTDNSEYLFIQALKQYTQLENLCYDNTDLINFHICVKTNPLTILAGMSGTGKTQLALAYSRMLDLSEEDKNLLFMPISPSYTEPGDILGYLNSTNGLFVPSETGLTDFLVKASKNPDKMHMVIFDEMNLSQVEHWFAPFISLLEKEPSQRRLQLYSEKAYCINRDTYPNQVEIGENIIFIGTVNIDETTKDFSDRLLDRANVVILRKKGFVDLKEEQEVLKQEEKNYEKQICSSYTSYSLWINKKESLVAYRKEELVLLDKLHELLQQFDNQKGVSFRIFKKIGQYLNNIPKDKEGNLMISREVAFDLEIKQRLITKIKGTERQFESLIGTAEGTNPVPVNSLLYEFFNSDAVREISEFELTKKEICRKARELGVYGYTN